MRRVTAKNIFYLFEFCNKNYKSYSTKTSGSKEKIIIKFQKPLPLKTLKEQKSFLHTKIFQRLIQSELYRRVFHPKNLKSNLSELKIQTKKKAKYGFYFAC